MIWISIILSIIEAIPAIITIIKDIIDLINGHPFQIQYEFQLHNVLANWQSHKDPERLKRELGGLHSALKPTV